MKDSAMNMNSNKTFPIASTESGKTKRAKLTGEFRPPLKGEWYLSGAIPEAYKAPNDLSTAYHIVVLVDRLTQ